MAHSALSRASRLFFYACVLMLVDIFRVRHFNRLFLGTMGCGILARLLSLWLDGSPSAAMLFFLIFEGVAFTLILASSRMTLERA